MEQIIVAKKWGNSFGIVIPMEIVKREGINEGTEMIVDIKAKHKTKVKEVFGILKKELAKIDTQKALKEVDKAFWSPK
ncbi:MAG: AbrB/MazE/SpoVT family DNA-binding domain-containing protein [Nanoarchaeota archaeon]